MITSEEYPLGEFIEPYDIELEKQLINEDDGIPNKVEKSTELC